nr:phosphocholine cytidylyltransferase family protein [Roseobacter litoralis]
MKYEINRPPKAVILAASVGLRLNPQLDACAKCMLSVGGSIVLERMIRNCLSCGISQFVLVLGHRSDEIREFVNKTFRGIRVTYVLNDRYHDNNDCHSLMLASDAVGIAEFIKFDANMVFETRFLRTLLDTQLPNVLCVNYGAALTRSDRKVVVDEQMRVVEIGKSVTSKTARGKLIGIEKISAVTGPLLFSELKQMKKGTAGANLHCGAAYEQLIKQDIPFHTLDTKGSDWTRIDTIEDFEAANAMFGSPVSTVSRDQQRAFDEAAEETSDPT